MKILIYNSGGGIGDSIQLFDILNSIKKKFITSEIYYLTAHDNHFNNKLKDFKISLKSLKVEVKYFGFRLHHFFSINKIIKENSIDEFDLIIDLQSKLRNTLILKKFPHKFFYSSTFNFKFCNIKKNYISSKYDQKNIISNLEKMLDEKIIFSKYDIKSIDNKYFEEAKKLLPDNNYIGFSITQGNEYRKKSWSIENFINLSNELYKKNKKSVYFIEKGNSELINKVKNEVKGVLFPEHNSSLSGPPLVTALSTRLEKAISIDNGIMHMIGLANIPMIVLFGPTNSKKFAPKINDIKILDSKEMYGSKDILKITEKDVLDLI